MTPSLTIARRNFTGFFCTPIGWIAACLIFLISGTVFYIVLQYLLARGQSVDPTADIFGQILGFSNYINIFVVPAFTMKVMSEELNSGTYRLHAAAPISTWSIVLGKFLSIMYYFGVIGLCMFIYPLFTFIFTSPDIRVILSGWLGLLLNIASVASIGLFIGSLTKSPILSYLGSSFFIVIFIFSAFIPGMPDWYRNNVNLLDLTASFTKGVINTGSVATFLGITWVFLTLTHLVLDSKKWRV